MDCQSIAGLDPFNGEYKDVKRALDMKRVELKSSWLNSAKSIIAGIFRYTFEEIESWDAEMFFERLAYAEFVCGRKLEPGDPTSRMLSTLERSWAILKALRSQPSVN